MSRKQRRSKPPSWIRRLNRVRLPPWLFYSVATLLLIGALALMYWGAIGGPVQQ